MSFQSLFLQFPDQNGHEIAALLNATDPAVKRAPVIIIPSPYGRKKEAFAPLVATLLSSFLAAGKKIITLRYDGINRPGESYQDDPQSKSGYEMLSYRISQGLSDLRAAVRFAHDNQYFTAEKVVIVSFSMSAIDVRRLMSQEESGIDSWVSCMGVPAAQTTLRSILGGIDVISNHRLGVPNGVMGLLGHLIDMDTMAADVVENKYAFLPDARLDMSRLSIPVVWISGLYDKWVDLDEVRDLMTVKAGSSREIIEIPTGHNLRTSDDAIQTFKIVANCIHERLFGAKIEACDPVKEELLRLVARERERLQKRETPPLSEYWHGYLMGNDRNREGYDFYKNFPEFEDFFRAQISCLGLGKGEMIADLGCGTGILLEELLSSSASSSGAVSIQEVLAVDLVHDALEKTRQKCEALAAENPCLATIEFTFCQKNLEPNRLIPVARFNESSPASLESLRNRIGGLSSRILDRLIEIRCPGSVGSHARRNAGETMLSRALNRFSAPASSRRYGSSIERRGSSKTGSRLPTSGRTDWATSHRKSERGILFSTFSTLATAIHT